MQLRFLNSPFQLRLNITITTNVKTSFICFYLLVVILVKFNCEMTNNRSRFCVLFRGTEEKHPVKTRLLYNDSSKEDINEIWSQIYEEAAPADAGLIIGGKYRYSVTIVGGSRITWYFVAIFVVKKCRCN